MFMHYLGGGIGHERYQKDDVDRMDVDDDEEDEGNSRCVEERSGHIESVVRGDEDAEQGNYSEGSDNDCESSSESGEETDCDGNNDTESDLDLDPDDSDDEDCGDDRFGDL
jgi:hypothetical protein